MAIDLPAPIEPHLYDGSPAEFRQQAKSEPALSFGVYRIHVLGDVGLSGEQHAEAVADAETLSDAVRAIALAHYLAGSPATQLRYLLIDQDLYITTSAAAIQAVQGRRELTRYFAPLIGREDLRAADLEPARALASIEADRRGIRSQLRFAPADRGLTLAIDETATQPQPFGARFNVGNPGNRYAGREFVEAEARLTHGAIEGTASQRSGLREDGDYDEQSVAVSWVAPQGMFGFSGRTARYALAARSGGFEGQTRHLGLQWSVLPYADFSTRWLLTLRIDSSNDRLSDAAGTTLIDERFDSLGADLSRAQVWADGDRSAQLQLALSVDAGQGHARGNPALIGADEQFLALRPRISFSHARAMSWTATLELSGQHSTDTLPQQQQFVLGGARNLGAWLPGVAVGDSGALARAELGHALDAFGLTLTPRLFAEIATWTLNGAAVAGPGDTDWLADAGVELVIGASTWLEASLSAAIPLPDAAGRNADFDDARADAYFSVTLRY
jgi:hemolysin activation/secretion protein